MEKSASSLATDLLKQGAGGVEVIRIHEFADDESANDEQGLKQLYREFADDLARAQAELARSYGAPARTGDRDGSIPQNGVFRFAEWNVRGTKLYLAAAHEDRGCPILLVIGT